MCTYDMYLSSSVRIEELTDLCSSIFKYGEFDRLPEVIPLVMPIVNIVYYQSIFKLDDRCYAREDLIQDVLSTLYYDMKYKWDKYIHVDNYYEYIKRIAYKVMIQSVYKYHGGYCTVEYDPEIHQGSTSPYDYVDLRLSVSSVEDSILDTVLELASHRLRNTKVLLSIISRMYYEKEDDISHIISMYRVAGINLQSMRMYQWVARYLYNLVSESFRLSLVGDGSMSKRYEEVIDRIASPDYETLSLMYGDSILPEIYAEFGQDVLLRMVQLFGGTTISIPDSRGVGDTLLGSTVFMLADGKRDNLESVSITHNLSLRTLSRIYDKYISDTMRKESYKKK